MFHVQMVNWKINAQKLPMTKCTEKFYVVQIDRIAIHINVVEIVHSVHWFTLSVFGLFWIFHCFPVARSGEGHAWIAYEIENFCEMKLFEVTNRGSRTRKWIKHHLVHTYFFNNQHQTRHHRPLKSFTLPLTFPFSIISKDQIFN